HCEVFVKNFLMQRELRSSIGGREETAKEKTPLSVFSDSFEISKCAHLGSNQGPKDYESSSLTALTFHHYDLCAVSYLPRRLDILEILLAEKLAIKT
ncbi:hypothetical protein DDV81_09380, partial [Campylobacter jejuni]|uniref:hypothetical protein n=1 Tax=Campylobacter jejuni TaxID=197 RepID=UPI000D566A11